MTMLNPRVDIEKALHGLSVLSLDKEEREIYEARLKWLRDEDATLKRAIEKKLHEIAKKQLKRGVSPEIIAEDTGLTLYDKKSFQVSPQNHFTASLQ